MNDYYLNFEYFHVAKFKIIILPFRIIPETASLQRSFDQSLNTKIMEFRTSENYNEGLKLRLDHVLDFVMRVDMMLNGNSSLTVILQNRESKDAYFLHYITSDILITTQVLFNASFNFSNNFMLCILSIAVII